jgi:serine/threonine protein kinase
MIGKQILNYRIERLIGEGGMGNVYLAVHTHIGRQVAIKALNPMLARNPEIRERFKNEASMLSQLHHPNIVQLYDYVEMDQGIYLVMEYAEGKPLDEYIEKVTGPIPEEKAIPLFTQIIDGVAYAHKKNVVHRDIKPSNIIVNTEGKVKILDFGIAKIIGDSNNKLTKTGTKLGTVLYMSPEQVKGLELDYRTDIYSLGITLYEMLTGRGPFETNSTEYEVYKKIVEEPLPDPRSFYPGISDGMTAILIKATEKDVAARFQSCSEFRQTILNPPKAEDNSKENAVKGKKEKKPRVKKNAEKTGRKSMLFWNIFMACFLATAIFLAIVRLLNLNDEYYVLANKLILRSDKSLTDNSNSLKILDFGSTVEIINEDNTADDNGYIWAKVRDESGKEGYVAVNFLGSKEECELIGLIFTDESQKQTNVTFKKAVCKYFTSNGMIDKEGKPEWKIDSEKSKGDYDFFALADFNNDGINDYACVVENSIKSTFRLIVFAGKGADNTSLIHDEELVTETDLRIMKKGEKISTGKIKYGFETDEEGNIVETQKKIYEPLASDALVARYRTSGKRFLYIFNISENRFNQPIEMK